MISIEKLFTLKKLVANNTATSMLMVWVLFVASVTIYSWVLDPAVWQFKKTISLTDSGSELILLAASTYVLFYSVQIRKQYPELGSLGWSLIIAGFAISVTGNLIDYFDEFIKRPVLVRIVWERGSRILGLSLSATGLIYWIKETFTKRYWPSTTAQTPTLFDKGLTYFGLMWISFTASGLAYALFYDYPAWAPLKSIEMNEVALKGALVIANLVFVLVAYKSKGSIPFLRTKDWSNFTIGLLVLLIGNTFDIFHEVFGEPGFIKYVYTSPTQGVGVLIMALSLASWTKKLSVPYIRMKTELRS